MYNWQLLDSPQDDAELIKYVINIFKEQYLIHFSNELLVNHNLPIEIRAFRHNDIWRVFLLLTPWTLARVFLPKSKPPSMVIPQGWQAKERVNAPFAVIGPALPLDILGGREMAHLNYHSKLGHYFIQPLIQSMEQFSDADEAFHAWNEVIKTRDRVIEEQNRHCEWQQEVSRREFFTKLRQRV